MVAHSQEIFKVLCALKQMHNEIGELRKEINELKNTLQRMEQTGLVVNFPDTESESETDESTDESTVSAPF